MNNEQIIKLAEEAGIDTKGSLILGSHAELQRFAELVRNAVLEEAANTCEELRKGWGDVAEESGMRMCAAEIRSMKKMTEHNPPEEFDRECNVAVGDSTFEGWYSTYDPSCKGDKQRARDAYEAALEEAVNVCEKLSASSNQIHAGVACVMCAEQIRSMKK